MHRTVIPFQNQICTVHRCVLSRESSDPELGVSWQSERREVVLQAHAVSPGGRVLVAFSALKPSSKS